MKHIIIALAALLISTAAVFGRSVPGEKVGVSFSELVHDFGTVPEKGGNVTCRFVITNNSTEPVALTSVVASCGCTKPKFDKKPIAPGSTSTIEVSYRPAGQKGEFDKELKLRLKSGSGKEERVKLRITGTVLP